MELHDLKTFSEIGYALWSDPERSRKISVDTLGAVALRDFDEETLLESGTQALLARAANEGSANNSRYNLNVIDRAFFRLFPQERVILVGLHLGKWSYARLARVIGTTADNVQKIAWKARLQVSTELPRSVPLQYPTGNKSVSANCPEYHSDSPWTQRFLDNEFSTGAEKLFLQQHLIACASCRATLEQGKAVYYAVDASIPRLDARSSDLPNLERVLRKAKLVHRPASTVTLNDAL
ncbi:MAG: hypothetical protein AABZ55_01330, partial [Bdellovibrionota bacterium]